MTQARLPADLIRSKVRTVGELTLDEEAWINWNYMVVDAEHRCFVVPETLVMDRPLNVSIQVRRTEAGLEVRIPKTFSQQWEITDRVGRDYLPVVKLEREI